MRLTGLSRRRGFPVNPVSSESSSSSAAVGEIWLSGRPELENLGSSGLSSRGAAGEVISGCCFAASSSSRCPLTGLRARFPVGTIRTPGRSRPLKIDPRGPVEFGSSFSESSSSSSAGASEEGIEPRTACDGPGKSSGTMGRPRTRVKSGGGVVPKDDSVPTLKSAEENAPGSSPNRVASVDGRFGLTRRIRVPDGVDSLFCSSSFGCRPRKRVGALEAVKSASASSTGCVLGNVTVSCLPLIGTRFRVDSASRGKSGKDRT